ncbi:bacteriocin immunity protein [Pseudomonas sp. ALS1279]|nr:bacteriocin immunity protein [Pseudomonas sp. ALS1279]
MGAAPYRKGQVLHSVFAAALDQFREITGHPDGTDLIYYCESDAECTPERITQKVKSWRAANGLPGFKST